MSVGPFGDSHPQHNHGADDWSDERDRLAEEWLIARHGSDWYIGNATEAEWSAAYVAVDDPAQSVLGDLTSRGQSKA